MISFESIQPFDLLLPAPSVPPQGVHTDALRMILPLILRLSYKIVHITSLLNIHIVQDFGN